MNNHKRIVEDGDIRYIIGRGVSEEELTITSVIGGTLMAASTDGYTNDPCDQSNLVDLESKEEHYTRDPEGTPEKPLDDRSELRRLLDDGIERAFEVIDGGKRSYLKQIGANRWTMFVLEEVSEELAERILNGFVDWRVKTVLTDVEDGEQYFDSVEDAVEEIPEVIDEMDCWDYDETKGL